MTKRTHKLAPLSNEEGQISIFFSASLVVLISIVAFVINIGLFVKAKINLQNATDAAAYAGAAVQARQLTTISYLNWEMRNIYKEWMYKYYVIGNMNVPDVENPPADGTMSFRLEEDRNAITNVVAKDPYNFPAVCIHLAGSKTNICRRYAIPGLPEFGSYNLPGAEEASRAFMDSLIGSKVQDCIERTKLNMLVASTWTYNVLATSMDDTLAGQGPAILSDRQGAWPKAVEVAMRIRNLEFALNRKAQTSGVCNNPGNASGTGCSQSISDISNEKKLGNERLVKAFYSGYRNLGGSDPQDEMKNSFTLTEISPQIPSLGTKTSASYLLVPEQKIQNYQKPYVDLKLMMVNYSIFYAAMIPRATKGSGGEDKGTSGACDVSKVAIPVPGYPMGFYKNPSVVTYYAVRGEAEFVGMFNPFGGEPIKLTAYSAAKPFGGRIGPMLFHQKQGDDYFTSRNDGTKYRSVPYITSLDLVGMPKKGSGETLKLGEFSPGAPLPINFPNENYWLESPDSPIGGLMNNANVQFGIPNLVYDYQVPFYDTGYTQKANKLHVIRPSENEGADQAVGLFSSEQFRMFKGTGLTGEVSAEMMKQEINRIKAPTLYEAANYLVPTPMDFNLSKKLDSFGFIESEGAEVNGVKTYQASIYAPLFSEDQDDVLWKSNTDVVNTIFEFMRAQVSGIDKYRRSLNQAAYAVSGMKDSTADLAVASGQSYVKAASGISDIDFSRPNDFDQPVKSCASIAGSFLYFYYGAENLFPGKYVIDNKGCPTPLGTQLETYFSSAGNLGNYRASHYRMEFSFNTASLAKAPQKELSVMSAYMPGPFNGVSSDGTFENPIANSDITEVMRRNFYSTKFVTLDSLQNNGNYSESSKNFAIYSEGDIQNNADYDGYQQGFLNSLNPGSIGAQLGPIKY